MHDGTHENIYKCKRIGARDMVVEIETEYQYNCLNIHAYREKKKQQPEIVHTSTPSGIAMFYVYELHFEEKKKISVCAATECVFSAKCESKT